MKNGRQFVFYINRKVEGTQLSQNARQKLFNQSCVCPLIDNKN